MNWEEHTADVTSSLIGFTAPMRELYDELHKRGWTTQKVKVKEHSFHATAKSPHGEKIEATGPTEETAVGNLLSKIMRKEHIRSAQYKVGMWETTFEGELQQIAEAYADAPTYDPKAAAAWMELARDCVARAQTLQSQLQVEVVDEPTPYKTADELRKDVKEKRHIYVTRAYAHHPVWSVDQVIAFRACVDVLGHTASGGDWGWHGTNQAFAMMAPLTSEEAQKALFSEMLGQTAYQQVYRQWGPQKIAFLDDLIEKAQKDENKPGHQPVHPSQSLAPGGVPDVGMENPAISGDESRKAGRNTQGDQLLSSAASISADSGSLADPNHRWESGVNPLPDNAYLWQQDPTTGVDPLDVQNVMESAYQINPNLSAMPHSMAQQAVANAFRAALLGPRKSEMHNAQHYQHTMGVPGDVEDPMVYWHALEEQRRQHNVNLGLPEPKLPFQQELQQFKQWVRTMQPRMNDGEVHDSSSRELFHMLQEEEERVLADDPQEKLPADQVEMLAWQNLQRRLKVLTKPKADQKLDFGNHSLFHSATHPGPYGSYLASHIRPITGVAKHIGDLTTSALDDLNDGGSGHTFRSKALSLGIPGITPKTASLAWLYLNPHGSQLAPLDPHLMETLGHDYATDLSDRDYFKHERELAAGRDAAGYGHVPLGPFAQGLRDYKTGGAGFHQDYSPLRVLNPTPWERVDWPNRQVSDNGWQKPYWWESTQPARTAVADDWDQMIAVNHPKGEVPFQRLAGLDDPSPWFSHPESGREYTGAPGESLMQFLKMNFGLNSVHDVWALDGLDTRKVR